jgi:hypothetical protein
MKKKIYDEFLKAPNYKKWIEKDVLEMVYKEL